MESPSGKTEVNSKDMDVVKGSKVRKNNAEAIFEETMVELFRKMTETLRSATNSKKKNSKKKTIPVQLLKN